ncbi:MAG TPA: hypothetical protein P5511_03095, partial [Candidatus Goldiibacteriota bacterium]|nr:hypothetical protein [Candidatus Goldiibacteriota bacterium]
DPSVDYYDLSFAASFADTLHGIFSEEFFKQISYGLTARIILQQIGPHRGSAIAFDAGLVFAPENTGFRAGLSLMNVGLPMGTIRGDAAEGDPALSDSPLPLTLKLGAYYLMKIDESNETGISADYSHDFYDFGSVSLGIEHSLMKTLYLRLGYCLPLADNNPHTLSAGLGIYITTTVPVEVTVGLNYAFKLLLWDAFNEPGPGHAASLILRF